MALRECCPVFGRLPHEVASDLDSINILAMISCVSVEPHTAHITHTYVHSPL